MIDWLVQSRDAHPDLAQGTAPEELLTAWEQERLAALKFSKRRQDWLLGRWTAKRLLQGILRDGTGQAPALTELQVANDASGAPYVTGGLRYNHCQVSLSISHAGDRAFCAAVGVLASGCLPVSILGSSSLGSSLLGADIEQVESRPPGFVEDYFTQTEISLLNRTPARCRDLIVTATWSGKEAALKAVHLGLTVDTRTATCLVEPVIDPKSSWAPFQIEWDVHRLNRYLPSWGEPPQLIGWWRIVEGYVLTLASQPSVSPRPYPLIQE